MLCLKCGSLIDPPDAGCAACAAVAAAPKPQRVIDPWRHLQPRERRILDLTTGREWSEYDDGTVRDWTPAKDEVTT